MYTAARTHTLLAWILKQSLIPLKFLIFLLAVTRPALWTIHFYCQSRKYTATFLNLLRITYCSVQLLTLLFTYSSQYTSLQLYRTWLRDTLLANSVLLMVIYWTDTTHSTLLEVEDWPHLLLHKLFGEYSLLFREQFDRNLSGF